MSTITLLGSEVPLEFEGNFENATIRNNVGSGKNGNLIYSAGGDQDECQIGWTFESSGGPRGIYVAYASDRMLPCELALNGDTLVSQALIEPTGGHIPRFVDWRYQVTALLKNGTNQLLIRRLGDIPFISALGVGTAPGEDNANVNAYAQQFEAKSKQAKAGAPFSISPRSLAGLLLEIQKLGQNDAAIVSFRSMLPHIVDATVEDAANGQTRIGFGGPLNGQRYRQLIFNRLLRLGVDAIVETGAYLGTSTAFFARQGLPVYSCELSESYLAAAIVQTANFPNVSLYLQDSRTFLRALAEDRAIDINFPFVYLDAHWNNDLPLADEIAIITSRWNRYAIMVDDFQVPGTDYGFDRYPNGLELTLDYLRRQAISFDRTAVLFPSATPTAESGKRRGTLVLVPEEIYTGHLRKERLLYRYRNSLNPSPPS